MPKEDARTDTLLQQACQRALPGIAAAARSMSTNSRCIPRNAASHVLRVQQRCAARSQAAWRERRLARSADRAGVREFAHATHLFIHRQWHGRCIESPSTFHSNDIEESQ
jgi:hypothetical protein